MSTILTYVDAVPGRLYPLPTLPELQARGHHLALRCGIDDVEGMRMVGLAAEPLAGPIERFANLVPAPSASAAAPAEGRPVATTSSR